MVTSSTQQQQKKKSDITYLNIGMENRLTITVKGVHFSGHRDKESVEHLFVLPLTSVPSFLPLDIILIAKVSTE